MHAVNSLQCGSHTTFRCMRLPYCTMLFLPNQLLHNCLASSQACTTPSVATILCHDEIVLLRNVTKWAKPTAQAAHNTGDDARISSRSSSMARAVRPSLSFAVRIQGRPGNNTPNRIDRYIVLGCVGVCLRRCQPHLARWRGPHTSVYRYNSMGKFP